MPGLHLHYDQLTDDERDFVDRVFRNIYEYQKQRRMSGEFAPTLLGDDRAERAVDAVAKWILESKK